MSLGELIAKRDALCAYEQRIYVNLSKAEAVGDGELSQLLRDYAILVATMIAEAESRINAWSEED